MGGFGRRDGRRDGRREYAHGDGEDFMTFSFLNTLPLAVIGHLVGDYLLQTDYQAAGKKSNWICAVHCFLWTAAVVLLAGWWVVWWVPVVLFVTHFIQDRTDLVKRYMHAMGQRGFAGPPMAPWSVVAVDNTFHLLTLALIAKFVTVNGG